MKALTLNEYNRTTKILKEVPPPTSQLPPPDSAAINKLVFVKPLQPGITSSSAFLVSTPNTPESFVSNMNLKDEKKQKQNKQEVIYTNIELLLKV